MADTIVAPATPPGEGGIAVIRLSGPRAEQLLLQHFRPRQVEPPSLTSHQLYLGLLHEQQTTIDEVMAVVMRAPRSFTAEDVVEIHCHGSQWLVRRIVDLMVSAGARIARPGEFTQRAFLNGRLDLAQAEAVADLIHSRTEASGRVALNQLQGRLSQLLGGWRLELQDLLAEVETHIDFSEEDIQLPDLAGVQQKVLALATAMQQLLGSFEHGRLLQEGVRVLIFGKPNVGKSSLLNSLLGESRAIVTEVAGTTRDTIEEGLSLHGLLVRLIDTAGIRDTVDHVEREGVERARAKLETVDLILLVIDGHTGIDREDYLALESCPPDKTLLVVNKADRELTAVPQEFAGLPRVEVSAKTGLGLESLQQQIVEFFTHGEPDLPESVLLYERRHRDTLVRALGYLGQFQEQLAQAAPVELLALELRSALDAVGEVTGETVTNDILEKIFSRFCIGK